MNVAAKMKSLVSKQRDAVAEVTGTVGDLRNRIARAQEEIAVLERTPVPLEDATAALDMWLDRQVSRAIESVPVGSLMHGQPTVELNRQ